MTPIEAARAMVEEWRDNIPVVQRTAFFVNVIDDLVARLTPVFERAQERDTMEAFRAAAEKRSHALRERAEAAEAINEQNLKANDELRLKWRAAENRAEAAEQELRSAREELRYRVTKAQTLQAEAERRAEAAEAKLEEFTTDMQENNAALTARLDAAEAALAAARETCNRLNRRCQAYEAGLAEKIKDGRDRSGWGLGRMLANAAASMYEADVRRLREALRALVAMPTAVDRIRLAQEALAATEPKGEE